MARISLRRRLRHKLRKLRGAVAEILRNEPGTALGAVAMGAAALIGVGWASFSFGYESGKDTGQDELAAYRAAAGASLPEVTSGLLAVNKELLESLKVFDRNKVLETENASYQKQLSEAAKARADLDAMVRRLKGELRIAADEEIRLHAQIGNLTGEGRLITLTRNKSEPLGEGHIIGLADSISMTKLDIVQDNKDYQMSAGSSIPVDLSDKRCLLTLLSLEWSPASGLFDWSCNPK